MSLHLLVSSVLSGPENFNAYVFDTWSQKPTSCQLKPILTAQVLQAYYSCLLHSIWLDLWFQGYGNQKTGP